MSKVKIELNLPGVNAMMKSPEIQAALQSAGEAVAAAASNMSGGEAYGVRTHLASYVAITNVYPESRKAARANLEDNTLISGVGAAGLPTRKK